jgi:hypothetical protein
MQPEDDLGMIARTSVYIGPEDSENSAESFYKQAEDFASYFVQEMKKRGKTTLPKEIFFTCHLFAYAPWGEKDPPEKFPVAEIYITRPVDEIDQMRPGPRVARSNICYDKDAFWESASDLLNAAFSVFLHEVIKRFPSKGESPSPSTQGKQ